MNRDIIKSKLFDDNGKAIENHLFRSIQFSTSLNQFELRSIIDSGATIKLKESTFDLEIEEIYKIGKCIYFYELCESFSIKLASSIANYLEVYGLGDFADNFTIDISNSYDYPSIEVKFMKGQLISHQMMSCIPLLKDLELHDNGEKKIKFSYIYKPWGKHI